MALLPRYLLCFLEKSNQGSSCCIYLLNYNSCNDNLSRCSGTPEAKMTIMVFLRKDRRKQRVEEKGVERKKGQGKRKEERDKETKTKASRHEVLQPMCQKRRMPGRLKDRTVTKNISYRAQRVTQSLISNSEITLDPQTILTYLLTLLTGSTKAQKT